MANLPVYLSTFQLVSSSTNKEMIKKETVYKIGKIGKPHGVDGEVSFHFDDDIFDRVDADYLILDIDGILVCPATIDLSGAEIELVDVPRREFRLREALREYVAAHGEIDVVLIDCPPSLGLVTLNVMVAADEVMIPIQAEYYALEGLSQLWNTVERIGVDLNPGPRVSGMLLTMADKRTRLSEEVEGEVRSHFPDHTFATVIPRSVRISEAPSYAQTVVTYDPRNVGAIAYRKAALELCERLSAGE